MEPAKKHGQRRGTWPNEDTNGVLARRFMKRTANKQARRHVREMAGAEGRSST